MLQSFHRDQQPPGSSQQQQQQQQQPTPQSQSSLHVPESNGKVSPLKSSHSPSIVHLDHDAPPSSQASDGSNKTFTLSEHIDSIIAKDISGSNPSTGSAGSGYGPQQHHRGVYHPYHMPAPAPDVVAEHHSWKLRRALQHKEMEAAREREKATGVSSR